MQNKTNSLSHKDPRYISTQYYHLSVYSYYKHLYGVINNEKYKHFRPDNYDEGWYQDETTGEWYNQFDWIQDEATGEWYYEDRLARFIMKLRLLVLSKILGIYSFLLSL